MWRPKFPIFESVPHNLARNCSGNLTVLVKMKKNCSYATVARRPMIG
jgi:hypothetical protein